MTDCKLFYKIKKAHLLIRKAEVMNLPEEVVMTTTSSKATPSR